MESLGMYYIDDNDNDNENSFLDGNFLFFNSSKSNNISN